METYLAGDAAAPKKAPANAGWAVEHHPSSKKRTAHPGQGSFDFEKPAPTNKPLSKEIDRRKDFPVASLRLRAFCSAIDAGFVIICLALFLLAVRLWVGWLPVSQSTLIWYTAGALLISIVYKGLWCIAGEPTFGLRSTGLVVVSFDGRQPTLGQMLARLFSGYLGVASIGLGVVWALADQEKLSWHDHISQTFLTPGNRAD